MPPCVTIVGGTDAGGKGTNPIDQVRLLRAKYLISYFLSNSQDARCGGLLTLGAPGGHEKVASSLPIQWMARKRAGAPLND